MTIRSRRLSRLLERKSSKLALLLAKSGKTGNPQPMAKKSIAATVAAATVTIPAGILLGLRLWLPLAGICVFPVIPYFYPDLVLKDAAASRKEGVEKELPFFAVLVNVLGGAGLPLYSIMESGVGRGTFVAMEREALRVKRDVDVFGANPLDALEALATNHPSRRFADFVLGYCSKVRSGGDVAGYLSGESGELLRELEGAWGRYASRVGTVGTLMVTVFGVVPLLLLVVGFFSPGFAVEGLGIFAVLAVPFFAMALIVMIGRMQPAGDDILRGRWPLAAAAAAPAPIPGILTGQIWLMAALPILVFCLVYGFSVRERRMEMREEESALPKFLKDLMEFKRLEYDLGRSLVAISAQFHYGEVFDSVLKKLSAKLRSGVSLEEARPAAKTALGKIVFSVLGQMAYSGGGTVDTMFQLTHYTTRVLQMKEDSRSEVRPYLALSYITPLLLVFGVAFVGGVLSNLGTNLRTNGSVGGFAMEGYALRPELFQAADLLIVVTAAALGIVGAKIADLTARNTLRASTNLAIAVVATIVVPLLNISALFH
jgi:flagellar protein FlaJ